MNKVEAGKRLKEFADLYYKGRKKELAKALGLANPNQLADYFNGKAMLGNERKNIIDRLGFNIEYYEFGAGNITNTNTNDKTSIGERLKYFCEGRFTNYAEVSKVLGFKNDTQIYDYYKGKAILAGEKLSILSNLGCDINWLLTGRETAGWNQNNIDPSSADELVNKLKIENELLRELLRERDCKCNKCVQGE